MEQTSTEDLGIECGDRCDLAKRVEESVERQRWEVDVSDPENRSAVPDWSALVREMKRPGVNLSVLFEEYQGVHPDGYAYSRYVAAKIMLRLLGRARETADSLAQSAT